MLQWGRKIVNVSVKTGNTHLETIYLPNAFRSWTYTSVIIVEQKDSAAFRISEDYDDTASSRLVARCFNDGTSGKTIAAVHYITIGTYT